MNNFTCFTIGFLAGFKHKFIASHNTTFDFFGLFLIYFINYFARFSSILLLSPILKALNTYRLTPRKILILGFSNFKMDMSLLLGVYGFTQVRLSETLRAKCMFYVAGSVIVFHLMGFLIIKPILKKLFI